MTSTSPSNDENIPDAWAKVMATKPLSTGPGPALLIDRKRGSQAFRHSVAVMFKRIKHDRHSLLYTIRASLPLPLDETLIF